MLFGRRSSISYKACGGCPPSDLCYLDEEAVYLIKRVVNTDQTVQFV